MYSLPSRRIRLFKFRNPVAVRSNQIITQRHNIINGKLTLQMRIQHCGLINVFLPMSHAARLLATTTLTLEEIAPTLGCKTEHRWARRFVGSMASLREPIAASLRRSDKAGCLYQSWILPMIFSYTIQKRSLFSLNVSPSHCTPRTMRVPNLRQHSSKPSFFARPIIRILPDQVCV